MNKENPSLQKRKQNLQLVQNIFRNTNFDEHRHRNAEIKMCFMRILSEEFERSKDDQKLIKIIINEFPQYFQ